MKHVSVLKLLLQSTPRVVLVPAAPPTSGKEALSVRQLCCFSETASARRGNTVIVHVNECVMLPDVC